ncbi:MAG: helical backbone metal receptor [Desulfobaccales bacterium]
MDRRTGGEARPAPPLRIKETGCNPQLFLELGIFRFMGRWLAVGLKADFNGFFWQMQPVDSKIFVSEDQEQQTGNGIKQFFRLLIHGVLTVLVLLTWLNPEIHASAEGQARQVFPPAPPARLVSLAPSITEILYFLELGDRVAGVTSFCNYPPEVKDKPRVGTYWEFNLEAILHLKPDLVLAMAHQGEGDGALDVLRHRRNPYY